MIDINSMDQGGVYMLFEVLTNMVKDLEGKADKTSTEIETLSNLQSQLQYIENWARAKMLETLHWTKEEILLRFGHKPTLIMEFHPGSKAYSQFGKEVVGNLEFSSVELFQLLENIRNKTPRSPSLIKFKKIPDLSEHEIATSDIFQLGGRQ